jgi:hypothetical protein
LSRFIKTSNLINIPDSSCVRIYEEQGLRISGNDFERFSRLGVTRHNVVCARSDVIVAVVSVERDDGREGFRVFGDFRKVDRLRRHGDVVVDVEGLDEDVETRRQRNGAVILSIDG